MDPSSNDQPEEVQKLVYENSVKTIVYHAKTDDVPASYELEVYDNVNDITNDFTGTHVKFDKMFFIVQKFK